ncbi:nucleotidyltransferase domain-containing protein [Gehongia tenuis]|uniref:Nucleotidyltransferase domain-containing protein n=1 Tax=Gehongia tenuis TaxID=2763655 RepID=A0A926HQ25_9FIRM|nr:nucleotidyltransferase domain-containing protein [Gehongia tenuis]MBC8531305.1 nucleotidyltransferase domain-containing protein [Gehongia tenuis]
MDEMTRRAFYARNDRIVAAIIQRAQKQCPGSLALIGVFGSFLTGAVHEKSDLDLLIVVNDERGSKALSQCFIMDGIGFDLYCTPWNALEADAKYTHPHLLKLMNSKILYCGDESYQQRLQALRDEARQRMAGALSWSVYHAAQNYLSSALKALGALTLLEDPASCRYQSVFLIHALEDALCMLNQTYYQLGTKKRSEELASFPRLPADFMNVHRRAVEADTLSEIKESSTRLARIVNAYFEDIKAGLARPAPTAGDLRGSYEEMFSNWRNKMRRAAKENDLYLSLTSAAAFQACLLEFSELFDLPSFDMMSRFESKDLIKSAEAFDAVLDAYRGEYRKAGLTVQQYTGIDDFEQQYNP